MKNLNKIVVISHLTFWILNWFKNYFLFDFENIWDINLEQFVLISIFYLNYFILIPYFFKPKKAIYYFLWALLFFSVFTGVYTWLIFELFVKKMNHPMFFYVWNGLSVALYYAGMSITARMGYDYAINMHETRILEEQKRQAEIDANRSPLNLNFFTSALELAEKQSKDKIEKTAETIIQLSTVLKYNLYKRNKYLIDDTQEAAVSFMKIAVENALVDATINVQHDILWIEFKDAVHLEKFIYFISQHYQMKSSLFKMENLQLQMNINTFTRYD